MKRPSCWFERRMLVRSDVVIQFAGRANFRFHFARQFIGWSSVLNRLLLGWTGFLDTKAERLTKFALKIKFSLPFCPRSLYRKIRSVNFTDSVFSCFRCKLTSRQKANGIWRGANFWFHFRPLFWKVSWYSASFFTGRATNFGTEKSKRLTKFAEEANWPPTVLSLKEKHSHLEGYNNM